MTNEQKQVRDWMLSFGQECPEKPTVPSLEIRRLRAKLILEEALETIRALGFELDDGHLVDDLLAVADDREPLLEKIADGCEDLKVVTEGTLVACGLLHDPIQFTDYVPDRLKDPLFDEVMRSNWSKFWKYDEIGIAENNKWKVKLVSHEFIYGDMTDARYLIKDSDGKVIKSPSYSPANFQPIIEEMSQTK